MLKKKLITRKEIKLLKFRKLFIFLIFNKEEHIKRITKRKYGEKTQLNSKYWFEVIKVTFQF